MGRDRRQMPRAKGVSSMALQRWSPVAEYIGTGEYVGGMEVDQEGDYVELADVRAGLQRLRVAIEVGQSRAEQLALVDEMIGGW